jgi:predicted DNA-binding protein with PD1-like motif
MKELIVKKVYAGRGAFGGDLLEEIQKIASDKNIRFGQVQVIGALSSARVGFYDQAARRYDEVEISDGGAVEILSAIGNISIKDGAPFPHIHLTASDAAGRAFGGHMVKGCKIFAAEIFITELAAADGADADFVRAPDEATGLALWRE